MPTNATVSPNPTSSRPLPADWRWVRLGDVLTALLQQQLAAMARAAAQGRGNATRGDADGA